MAAKKFFKMPGEYVMGGFPMPEKMCPKATLENLIEGQGPNYEVLVASFPRSGTARVVEVAWLLLNNCDVKKAKELDQSKRHLFLDLLDPDFKTASAGKPLPEGPQKLAKTHYPYDMVAKHINRPGVKTIVGTRNPKDNLVSLYHFYRMNVLMGNYEGSFEEFFEMVKAGHVIYGDIVDFNLGYWKHRDSENMMFVSYEDLTANPAEEIMRMAKFLGVQVTPEQLQAVLEWTTFKNMSTEKSTNMKAYSAVMVDKISPYMRKGTVGDWKNTFTAEQSKWIDDQVQKKCTPQGQKYIFEFE